MGAPRVSAPSLLLFLGFTSTPLSQRRSRDSSAWAVVQTSIQGNAMPAGIQGQGHGLDGCPSDGEESARCLLSLPPQPSPWGSTGSTGWGCYRPDPGPQDPVDAPHAFQPNSPCALATQVETSRQGTGAERPWDPCPLCPGPAPPCYRGRGSRPAGSPVAPPELTSVEEACSSQPLRPHHGSQWPVAEGGQPQLLRAHPGEGRSCRWGSPGPLLLFLLP